MSRPYPWMTRAALQLGLAWVLIADRVADAMSLGAGHTNYVAGLLIVGLALFWPAPGPRLLKRLGGECLLPAAALAQLGWMWHAAWSRGVGPGLTPALRDVGPWLLLVAVLLLDWAAVARVGRLLGIEIRKLAGNRLVRVGLLGTAAVAALAGLTHEPLPRETAWGIVTAVLGAGFAAAQVFVLVLGAIAIAGEASQGTLKMILPHAYRRSDWVLAKGGALAVTALVFAALAALVAIVGGLLTGPLGDVTLTAEGFGDEVLVTVHAAGADMRAHLLDTILAQALALCAVGALGLTVSCLLPSVVGALCSAFLAFAVLKLGDLVLGLDADTLRRVFLWPPERLREVTLKLGQGLSEAWDARLPSVSLLLSAACAALCVLLAIRSFSRRDLHV